MFNDIKSIQQWCFLFVIIKFMKKTIKDLGKAGGKGIGYFKAGVYYCFIPIVIGMGLKTVDLSRFLQPQTL